VRLISLIFGLRLLFDSAHCGVLEDWVETATEPEAVEEWLDDLRHHPLDLNQANEQDLAALPFFDIPTAKCILATRDKTGGFDRLSDVFAACDLSKEQQEILTLLATVYRPQFEHASLRTISQMSPGYRQSQLRGDFNSDNTTRGFVRVVERSGLSDPSAGVEFRTSALASRLIVGDFQAETATGLVIAPGFVDIHTHADLELMANPRIESKLMQGVTTEVFSNCGLGFAPVASAEALAMQRKYLRGLFGDHPSIAWEWATTREFLECYRGRIATNIAYLVPHGALRVSAMGWQDRPATHEELGVMNRLLQAWKGAWG
jgi:hypothetical protein